MKRARILLIGLVLAAAGAGRAAAAGEAPRKTLGPGIYAAKVASLPCAGCADTVEKTMKSVPGIGEASVNGEMSSVVFSVKPGASVAVSTLQKRLKAASAKMGMGADYTLAGIIEHPGAMPAGKATSRKHGCSKCKEKHS